MNNSSPNQASTNLLNEEPLIIDEDFDMIKDKRKGSTLLNNK